MADKKLYGGNVRPDYQLVSPRTECHQMEAFSQHSIMELRVIKSKDK